MNILNNHSINVNNIRNSSPINVAVSQRTREQIATKQAESPRTSDWFSEPREINEITILRPYQSGDREWERLESGFRNYANLTNDDIGNLAAMASLLIFSNEGTMRPENPRSIAEMVSFVEEKLARLDNNANISEERRDIERRVLEEGLLHALSSSHRGDMMIRLFTVCATTDEKQMLVNSDNAENEINDAINFAFEVMQNASSLTNNTRLQEIIKAAMDLLVVQEIEIMSQMITIFDTNGKTESEVRNRDNELRIESGTFHVRMMEHFQNRRNDMVQSSELQIFPLRNSLSMFARVNVSV